MAEVNINVERCKGCGLCVPACRMEVLGMSEGFNQQGHRYAEVQDVQKCTACGMCYQMCPEAVIEVRKKEKAKRDVVDVKPAHKTRTNQRSDAKVEY